MRPHRQGTFKLSRDPAFAEKVADIVGLYFGPARWAVVLSIEFDATENAPMTTCVTATNLFAALNATTG